MLSPGSLSRILGVSDDRAVYRAHTAMVLAVSTPLIGVGALLLFVLSLNDAPSPALVAVGIAWLLITGLMIALAVRPRTTISRAGIEVRGPFGTRVHPWAEVADIQIEEVSSSPAAGKVFGAVIYDADLRRVALPYLHHKRLGSAQLESAMGELRRRWTEERGTDWRPSR